jgi:hypothetical protein
MTHDDVRAALLRVWGEQSCQRPKDWPDALKRLFTKCEAHGSYRPRVERAAVELATAFSAAEPPSNPEDAVWRAFAPLDAEHRRQLVATLLALRGATT